MSNLILLSDIDTSNTLGGIVLKLTTALPIPKAIAGKRHLNVFIPEDQIQRLQTDVEVQKQAVKQQKRK